MSASAIGIIFLLLCVILFLAVRLSGRRRAGNAGKAGDARLKRIKIVSDLVGTLIIVSLAIGAPYSLAVYLGWLPLPPGHKILISPHQLYASASDIPENVMALALVRWGLGVFCALVIYKLFRLYGRGIFFSARNVLYIRLLGYYLMIDWVVIYQLESLSREMALSCTQPVIGLLVIFIAWIMDEGRKIQEEQAFTV